MARKPNGANARRTAERAERIEQANALLLEGRSLLEISEEMDLHYSTAARYVNRTYWLQPSRAVNRDRAAALHRQGQPKSRIAATLGVTVKTVRAYLGEVGAITYSGPKASAKRERMAEAQRLFNEGASVQEISERLDVRSSAIRIYLADMLGVPKRPAPVVQPETQPEAQPEAVRALYEAGQPLRLIADRLGIPLEEARARLRQSHPDARDADVLSPEARTLANDRQRQTKRRLRQEAAGAGV